MRDAPTGEAATINASPFHRVQSWAFMKKLITACKHAHLSQCKRRVLHFLAAFLVGLLVARILSPRNSRHALCDPYSQLADNASEVDCADCDQLATLENFQVPSSKGSSKKLLFVGVMTAQKYLHTRAAAVYDTWGRQINGDVAFFTSATAQAPPKVRHLPLVRLKDVDDSYPPQKKSFYMLQYMWRVLGDRYEWFMRADDDVYIRPDKMERFLRSINSSKAHFIGQAGRGNQEEFGQLSLEYDENFCMGGPGIIFSRETLRRIAPHVKTCLRNLYTTHEDVELGRCVQRFARISCTWSYEMQSIFYHNFSGGQAFTESLKTKEVHNAITLHPIKQHQHMYRLHNYMRGLEIRELQQLKISLYRDLYSLGSVSHFNFSKNAVVQVLEQKKHFSNFVSKADYFGKPPSCNKYRPRNVSDVLPWDFISRSIYSSENLNPRRKLETHLKEGLDDIIRELIRSSNSYSRERGRVIEFQQILYGYYQLNPLYGPSYILDVLLTFKKYRGKKMTVPVRKHAYVQQQFASIEVREIKSQGYTDKTESNLDSLQEHNFKKRIQNRLSTDVQINMVVPLAGKLDAFIRFMNTFEETCVRDPDKNVALLVVLFAKTGSKEFNQTLAIINGLKGQYSSIVNIDLIHTVQPFSRAKALDLGMQRVTMEELLFFIDVDMIWNAETLQRVRLNTGLQKSVYFPVVFSDFDPTVMSALGKKTLDKSLVAAERDGYWRLFGFGIVSAYKADILEVGGFDTSIVGWGKEDVDLFDKFVQHNDNISIFRSADPNLVHIFHIVDCDNTLDEARLTMCHNTRSETYGSVNQLASLIYHYKSSIFRYVLSKNSLNSGSNN